MTSLLTDPLEAISNTETTVSMPFTLAQVAEKLQTKLAEASLDSWVAEQEARGALVALYRQYAEGEQRFGWVTAEMRSLMRSNATDVLNRMNANFMDIIVQTFADRLEVTAIESDKPVATTPSENGTKKTTTTATEWASELLADNRFDAMQGDVHEATIRDGDTYVLSYFDNEAKQVRFCHELAYDGSSGMLTVYESVADTKPVCAIKIWRVGESARVNYYYADRIERYVSDGSASLQPYETDGQAVEAEWKLSGQPLGVPVIHFKNRSNGYSNYGRGELLNAIPLQDAHNRTLYSLIMAAELTAFQIRTATGFKPPAAISIGMWVEISPDQPLSNEERAEAGVLEQGELAPYLSTLAWIESTIGKITRTPSPEFMGGDNASGESLKQREIGLIGKVRRFQVKAGNAWEDLMVMAHRIQQVFGAKKPPAYTRFYTKWADAEIRNDEVTIKNAMSVRELVGERETLRLVGSVYEYDENKITDLMNEKADDKGSQLAKLAELGINRFNTGNGRTNTNVVNNAPVTGVSAANGDGAVAVDEGAASTPVVAAAA